MPFVPLPCPSCGAGGDPGSPGDGGGGGGCPNGYASALQLCDITGDACVPFVRHIAYTCAGEPMAVTDTDLSGTNPYTPTGEVGDCSGCSDNGGSPGEACDPVPMCARLSGISGPDTWTMPPGTESLTINIVCGPITVTDCAGEQTILNEGCGTMSWSAPGTGCYPGELCAPFTVEIPEDSAVYVQWTEPCDGER